MHFSQRITQNIYSDGTNLTAVPTLISMQIGIKQLKMLIFETVQFLYQSIFFESNDAGCASNNRRKDIQKKKSERYLLLFIL